MVSNRRRNYIEKVEFKEKLAEFIEQHKEKYDEYIHEYMDEDSWEDIYNDYIDDGGYDDWYIDDDYYNDYYDNLFDDDYDWDDDWDDWDSSPFPKCNPGNHVRDKQNNTYVVAKDHKLVNILTGEYTYIHLLDDAKIIL